jgi:hypothetical protein
VARRLWGAEPSERPFPADPDARPPAGLAVLFERLAALADVTGDDA